MRSDDLFKALYASYFALISSFFVSEVKSCDRVVDYFVDKIESKISVVNQFYSEHARTSLDTLVVDDFSDDVVVNQDSLGLDGVVSSLPDFDVVREEFESKRVPVLMFHRIGEREDRYTVSPGNFERLLGSLYDNDFYSVSLEEFLDGDFSGVPVGKKPVLITFDDAHISQFRYDGAGNICDKSAVGIMERFFGEYDFGSKPVFFNHFGGRGNFVLPFGQNDYASDKMKFLVDNGYSVGYHTVFHDNNAGASKNDIFEQYTLSSSLFLMLLGEERFERVRSTKAHPEGAFPRSREVFDYAVAKYPDGLFNAWGGSSRHPLSEDFDVYSIPRIEITYHTLGELVLGRGDSYRVTPDTKRFYELLNNESEIRRLTSLGVDSLFD